MKKVLLQITLVTVFGVTQVQAGGVETCPTCGGTGVVGTKNHTVAPKTDESHVSYRPGPYEDPTVPKPRSLAGQRNHDRLPPVEVTEWRTPYYPISLNSSVLAGSPWRGAQGRFRNT